MKIIEDNFKILDNFRAGEKYFKLTLAAAQIGRIARPGQFVMAQVNDIPAPLLRRPLGVHRVSSGKIDLLYEVVGKGTEILSKKKRGEFLGLIGPLGNGFDCQLPTANCQPILVAGGMGVAPLTFLAEKLKKKKSIVLIGAKTKSHLACENEFNKICKQVHIATDDGSKGFHGRITELLKNILVTTSPRHHVTSVEIYSCGPKPMLIEISRISKAYKIPAQLSLEEHMSCGFGVCLGCAVNTIDGYKRVCKDGPVFEADDIIW